MRLQDLPQNIPLLWQMLNHKHNLYITELQDVILLGWFLSYCARRFSNYEESQCDLLSSLIARLWVGLQTL